MSYKAIQYNKGVKKKTLTTLFIHQFKVIKPPALLWKVKTSLSPFHDIKVFLLIETVVLPVSMGTAFFQALSEGRPTVSDVVIFN